MDTAVQTFEPTPEPSPRPSANAPQLRTLLLTDLVDSTGLVERMGDAPASDLFRAHDHLVLKLQQQWRGRLIDRSDGMLLLFERPIDGLGFALDYTRGLIALGDERGIELRARIGLHVGEVLTWRNSEEAVSVGAKPVEVEGLAKPMAARLMATARPGQILLSAVAEPLAHRAARELGERGQHLAWKSWGRWRFKGVPETQLIFEVGEPGIAPLRMPPDTPKAWRDIPLWRRPAALATEAALLAGLVAGAWFIAKPEPAIAFNQRDWVVVGDLRNLTGQAALDDSLEQAFRISLEQSRHVNVLSDLKARDTLGRMQRAPETKLDRAIASEIALRDGARAVILPTVAEVGGRVRVSAEVIDPRTQTTVYTETAEGTGIGSTLDSIDDVTAALRGKLGEAVKTIEKDSVPLPQVTTKNLDALRAYALGLKANANGRADEALQYYNKAIELDPHFALAHMGIVRILVREGETGKARAKFQQTLALRANLPPRDALYFDAWSAQLGSQSPASAPEKWKLLSSLYPDYYAGYANYAWAMFGSGHLDEALVAAQKATAKQNSQRAIALDQVGRIQLARGRYREALQAFRTIDAQSPGNRQYAAALAANEDFSAAKRVLDADKGSLTGNFERIAIAIDQKNQKEALRLAALARGEAASKNASLAMLFEVVMLAVQTTSEDAKPAEKDFQRVIDLSLDGWNSEVPDASDRIFFAAAATYLSQRSGGLAVAKRNLPRLQELAKQVTEPRVNQLVALVQANQLRITGDPAAAISKLGGMVDGAELFQVHVVLRDALEAAGRRDQAARESKWLQKHRGLAYGELAGGYSLQALNVSDTRPPRAAFPEG